MKAVTVTHDLQIGFTELEKPLLYGDTNEFIGGAIDAIWALGLKEPYVMIVNYDYMERKLPKNEIGSYLCLPHLYRGGPICGNILILKSQDQSLVGLEDTEILQVMAAMQQVKNLLASDVWRKGRAAL